MFCLFGFYLVVCVESVTYEYSWPAPCILARVLDLTESQRHGGRKNVGVSIVRDDVISRNGHIGKFSKKVESGITRRKENQRKTGCMAGRRKRKNEPRPLR